MLESKLIEIVCMTDANWRHPIMRTNQMTSKGVFRSKRVKVTFEGG